MSLDFSRLREAGITHLQELAGSIWTDYNTHDPGVTTLEALCYAITDLSYRCNFNIEDILASNPENRNGNSPDFFEAHQILPNHPLTIFDFRKILIDLPIIRNAWLEPAEKGELPIFYDEPIKELTFKSKDGTGNQNEEIKIKGLYNVWIEFAEDRTFGNLNSEVIKFEFEITDGSKKYPALASIFFPHYDDLPAVWKKEMLLQEIKLVMKESPDPDFDFVVQTKVTHGETNEKEMINLRIAVDSGNFDWNPKKSQVKNKISEALKETGDSGLFAIFNRNQVKIHQHVTFIEKFLNENRNLCEDFLSIKIVRYQEIALEGEIGISLDSDPHLLLAQALYDIQQFLNPSIRFYTLKELLKEKLSPEEIFEGPLLKHGFIKNDNLKAFRQCKTIFVSDILNLFISSNPEKITYVTGFKLANYFENELIGKADSNYLTLFDADNYIPAIGIKKSKIHCKKGEVYQEIDWNKVETLFNEKCKAGEPDKSTGIESRLEAPVGRDRKTSHYSTVQQDFPPTYGIGWSGLPENSTDERKALARQFKGYLLFFDQLFANFLAQLSNVKNILSIDGTVAQTYFEQAVYEVPDAIFLLKEFVGDKSDLSDKSALAIAWRLFKENPANSYIKTIHEINEDETTFTDRRNRFLDHLMARFGEQFTDYSLLMYASSNQQFTDELIADKVAFLKELPTLGSQRAKSFTSKDVAAVWDTENVSGLEKRVSRMLGFNDYSRRLLSKGPFGNIEFYQEIDVDIVNEYRFRVISDDHKIMLSSHKHYHLIDDGYQIIYDVLEFGKNPANYKIHPSVDGKFYFHLYDVDGKILARRIELFDTETEAQTKIDEVVAFISTRFTGIYDEPEEGFFVVEHLLLRPKYNEVVSGAKISDALLPKIRDDFGNLTDEGKNPYSFRVSAIFPAQLKKFANKNFQELAELTLRLETPAHIMPHVYFVNNLQLSRFERAYKKWLETSALPVPEDPAQKLSHLKNLNQALLELAGAMQFVPEEPDL
jgi:hypothetical protein